MAKRQNFVVGSTNSVTQSMTTSELNHGFDQYEILTADELDGVFNAVSDYSNDSSNEIANAIQSITGAQPTGSSENELANALQQMRNEIETTSLTFKGYVATSEPSSSTYALVEGNLWINSATMPTSFPVAASSIKQWNGTAWVNYGSTYTPADFDFFRNINDNEGYYWFGGIWTVMSTDMSTTYFTLNQSTGKWEIKSSVNLPGNPTTTTPDAADQSTKIATTQFARDFGQRYVTNCITEIPQDIKVELSNGALVVKAGSKLYVPTGSGTFDTFTTVNDITHVAWGGNSSAIAFIKPSNNTITVRLLSQTFSGSSAPSGDAYMAWYDTTNHVIKLTSDGGSTWLDGYAFPVCIATADGAGFVSIDRVFNGLGYIGSTVFALPGVKGLVPSGRNADGTLKGTAFTVSSVLTETTSSSGTNDLFLKADSIVQVGTGVINYDAVDNYNKGTGFVSAYAIVGRTMTSSGVITSFTPKTAFHAVDYSNLMYMLNVMYPIGALYFGTQNTCPMSILMPGTTWEIVATDRALWGGDGTNGNTTIAAGLPNITGSFGSDNQYRNVGSLDNATGAFESLGTAMGHDTDGGNSSRSYGLSFDASRSSTIYGASTTVQPPAYVVNVWRRAA